MGTSSKQPYVPELDLWINSSSSRVPDDKDTRTRIRRQAMSQVAAERKRWRMRDVTYVLIAPGLESNGGEYNSSFTALAPKQTRLEHPMGSFICRKRRHSKPKQNKARSSELKGSEYNPQGFAAPATSQNILHPSDPLVEGAGNVSLQTTDTTSPVNSDSEKLVSMSVIGIPESVSLKALPSFNIRYKFNPHDSSCKPSITIDRELSHPREVARLLAGRSHPSYSRYFEHQYGNNGCFTEAINCIFSRLRCLLSPLDTAMELSTITSYTRALRSMHRGLERCQQSGICDFNVLCTTELLALYEILNPTTNDTWVQHIAGASNIVRAFGPHCLKSDAGNCLFMSNVGLIITESIVNNEECFLEQPEWQEVLSSRIAGVVCCPSRSPMVTSLMTILARVPRLFHDTTLAILHRSHTNASPFKDVAFRAHKLRDSLYKWQMTHRDLHMKLLSGGDKSDGYCKMIVLFYSYVIIANRLLAAVLWGVPALVRELEQETQRFANYVMTITAERNTPFENLQGALHIAQRMRVAKATILTLNEWQPAVVDDTKSGGSRGMIEGWKFEHWCHLFGRKTC